MKELTKAKAFIEYKPLFQRTVFVGAAYIDSLEVNCNLSQLMTRGQFKLPITLFLFCVNETGT